MRALIVIAAMGAVAAAQPQNPPNCNGVGLDVDIRCACVKDPNGQTCDLYKRNKAMYDGNLKLTPPAPHVKPSDLPGAKSTPAPRSSSSRAQQARVLALPSTDYIRVIHPNAMAAVGVDLGKLAQMDLMQAMLGMPGGADQKEKIAGAFKEMDHLWLSVSAPADAVALMTGHFEQGAAAGMFYSDGVRPVFLGGPGVMMIGPEASIQAALARMAKPVAGDGWVAQRAKDLARDHEVWIAMEPPAGSKQDAASAAPLQGIRRFALGVRMTGKMSLDGEVVAGSDAGAQKIAEWVDQLKAALRQKTGAGALDALKVTLDGPSVHFSAVDDGLLAGDAGKKALNSDLGVELARLITGGLPGEQVATVAEDRILQVHQGMKRDEVLALLGKPQSVRSIQGLDEPVETWMYQVPFGKQYSVRLEGGVVSQPPR